MLTSAIVPVVRPPSWFVGATLAWVAATCAGWVYFAVENATPGRSEGAPRRWPEASKLALDSERPTLVVFAHPRCPCFRATLEELGKIAARRPHSASICVAFYTPSEADPNWTDTDQWATAASTPGVSVVRDLDGAEASRFGAATAGEAALYDADGRLRFHGGITPSRGHVGDNDGRDAVEAVLAGKTPAVAETPAFGCPLFRLTERPSAERS